MEKKLPIVWLLLRLALGGLFIWAGLVKVADAPAFTREIQHYDILPWPWLAAAAALYLPWVEILCGLGLQWPRLRLGSLLILGGLMVVFLGAITSAWARGLDITCGCFGKDSASILTDFPLLLTQDLALLAAATLLWWVEKRRVASQAAGSGA